MYCFDNQNYDVHFYQYFKNRHIPCFWLKTVYASFFFFFRGSMARNSSAFFSCAEEIVAVHEARLRNARGDIWGNPTTHKLRRRKSGKRRRKFLKHLLHRGTATSYQRNTLQHLTSFPAPLNGHLFSFYPRQHTALPPPEFVNP